MDTSTKKDMKAEMKSNWLRVTSIELRAEKTQVFSRLTTRRSRLAITLIEVLISMFVLLFGLMGVAAIFPVASHYVLEGDKRDRSSGLAQIAFEELRSRKYLRPTQWAIPAFPGYAYPFLQNGIFTLAASQGHAFIVDPLATAMANQINPAITGYDFFPVNASNGQNPWSNPPSPQKAITGPTWPIRRLTFDIDSNPNTATIMSGQTAETAFRLRDDLVTQQPEAGDRPSVQRWRRNGTQLLSREYTGDYSWLATVVPTRNTALLGLQPAAGFRDEFYEVTSVVFYKRDITPSATQNGSAGSERLINAEFLNSSELALWDPDTGTGHPETTSTALDGVKPTHWIAVCGVNQITGVFMMKWYKILAMDDADSTIQSPNPTPNAGGRLGRHLMVDGPEWPTNSYTNLRAIILPGAIDAYTQIMQLTNNITAGESMVGAIGPPQGPR
jgi:Tfp pilus assembly protein PilV